ncbi:MAG TPA: hypothetical protein VJK49_08260 [Candidatus Limnocylindrales bacterium]|nr:hypothetical protein [Candidatus Limnocylindrales bacterium]
MSNRHDIAVLGALDDEGLLGDDDDLQGDEDLEGMDVPLLGDGQVPLLGARRRKKSIGPWHYWPLGFPTQIFTNVSGTALVSTSAPFVAFKGKRLSIDIARTGATATGLITMTQLLVGQANQLPNANVIGAGTFAPNAVATRLDLAWCPSAVGITIALATSVAPGAGDSIAVQPTLLGISRVRPR